ncbi:AAA family ATPase [Methylobacterium indicum]|uniref:AAA family ATPase n=1 Tax=Methylobacterium indicum TaxID=1775910 RepID=UPI000734CC63|nr:AAA family ATPase [Methylobacterium indicum]
MPKTTKPKTNTLQRNPATADLDEFLGGTGDLREAAEDLAGTRVTTIVAMAALQDLLTPRQLERIGRRSATALVVQVPGPEWCDPMERALHQSASFGWICNRHGGSRSQDKSTVGNEKISDQLTCGLNVAGVSQDPARYLPGALVTGADIAVEVRLTDRVVRAAIALVTGKECRRLPPGVVAGLTLDEIAVAIRHGSSPAACRRRLVATAAAKVLPDASLADVPVLSELRGYEGAAMDWALALKAQVDDWRAGRIGRFDQIADRAVCFSSAPGLGKTTLARSVAKTLRLPILETSVAAWFANAGIGYLGEMVQQAEAVWQRAAAFGGPVVVLLDELDGLPARSSMSSRNRDFWAPIIHSLLLSLDGSGSGKTRNCIIIGATNHAEHLDEALIRPGRLNRVIHIAPPSPEALAAILRQHLGDDLPGVDLLPLATLASGSTGAMAAGWARTARAAARTAGRPMRLADLLGLVAEPDERSPEERLTISRHEAAHALCLEAHGLARVGHVTIVPRGRFAGRTTSEVRPSDTRSRADVEAHVVAILAGRAADEHWGRATTGSSGHPASDLGIATSLVAALHCAWGLGGTLAFRATYAEAADLCRHDAALRELVEADLKALHARARSWVEVNAATVDRLARRIAADGLVTGDTVRAILAEDRAGRDGAPGARRERRSPASDAPAWAQDPVPDHPATPMRTT